MQSLGVRLKYTEQSCMSNIILISQLSYLGPNTAMPCMHTSLAIKLESERYHKNVHGNWQLSIHTLRVETKPLSAHDCRKLASGLSKEGMVAMTRVNDFATMPKMHAPRIIRRTYLYSAQHSTFYLYIKSCSGKVKKLKIRK